MTSTSPLETAFSEICQMDVPLNERLAAYAAKLQEFNLPAAQAYDSLVARLNEGQVGSASPKVGELMPLFALPEAGGRLVRLDDLLERGPVVISLNRGHWCPFCKMELDELTRWRDALMERGTEVVAIMPDRQRFTSTVRKGGLRVLADIDNGYVLSIGLVMWLGDRIKDFMIGRGHNLEIYQGNDGWFVPVPATFVVGRDGRVIARHVEAEFRQRMSIESIIEAVTSGAKVSDASL